MISASTFISAEPARVYDFVANDSNFIELYKSKYDIKVEKKKDLEPRLGDRTRYRMVANSVKIEFVSEITRLEQMSVIEKHIVYEGKGDNGSRAAMLMPELVSSDSITPARNGSVLTKRVSLASPSFVMKAYFIINYIREYLELRRYVKYVKNMLEPERST